MSRQAVWTSSLYLFVSACAAEPETDGSVEGPEPTTQAGLADCGISELCDEGITWEPCSPDIRPYRSSEICTLRSVAHATPGIIHATDVQAWCGDTPPLRDLLTIWIWADGTMTCSSGGWSSSRFGPCTLSDPSYIEDCLAAAEAGEDRTAECSSWSQWGLSIQSSPDRVCGPVP